MMRAQGLEAKASPAELLVSGLWETSGWTLEGHALSGILSGTVSVAKSSQACRRRTAKDRPGAIGCQDLHVVWFEEQQFVKRVCISKWHREERCRIIG